MKYWDQQTEQHLKCYISDQSLSKSDRDTLYTLHLHKPFMKLIEGLIHHYRINETSLTVEDLQADVLAHVYSILQSCRENPDKYYNPDSGAAFSYFAAVIQYYLTGKENKWIQKDKTHFQLQGDESHYTDSNFDYSEFYGKLIMWLLANGEDLFREDHNKAVARAIIYTITDKMHLYYEGQSFKDLVGEEVAEMDKFESRYHRVKYIINKAFRYLKEEHKKGNQITKETRWKPYLS